MPRCERQRLIIRVRAPAVKHRGQLAKPTCKADIGMGDCLAHPNYTRLERQSRDNARWVHRVIRSSRRRDPQALPLGLSTAVSPVSQAAKSARSRIAGCPLQNLPHLHMSPLPTITGGDLPSVEAAIALRLVCPAA
jgi:hypothetical protein